MNNIVDEGIVSKFYPVFTFQNANSYFMMEYLNGSPRVRAKLSVLAVGTSQVVLSFETLKKTSFYLPTFEEQNIIAALLTTLNKRIDKQRTLVKHLKKYKRGLSESIFSSLSCSLQELSKVCDIIGGGTPDTGVLEYWNGDVYWFTPTEVGKKKYVSSSSRTITNEGLLKSSAKMLPPHTVLLTTRATLGEMSITTTACSTNQGFQSLVAKKDVILPEYLYYLQTIIKPWCEKYSSANTFREISKSALGKCTILVPSIKVQTRIVGCLSIVDNKIENCELILEHLTKMKSALVQRLFI
jgi:type I restriction enzyme S subunit